MKKYIIAIVILCIMASTVLAEDLECNLKIENKDNSTISVKLNGVEKATINSDDSIQIDYSLAKTCSEISGNQTYDDLTVYFEQFARDFNETNEFWDNQLNELITVKEANARMQETIEQKNQYVKDCRAELLSEKNETDKYKDMYQDEQTKASNCQSSSSRSSIDLGTCTAENKDLQDDKTMYGFGGLILGAGAVWFLYVRKPSAKTPVDNLPKF